MNIFLPIVAVSIMLGTPVQESRCPTAGVNQIFHSPTEICNVDFDAAPFDTVEGEVEIEGVTVYDDGSYNVWVILDDGTTARVGGCAFPERGCS